MREGEELQVAGAGVDTTDRSTGTFDDPRYAAIALEHAPAHVAADPFPHTVIEDFLPESLARELARSFPDAGQHGVDRARQRAQSPPLPD